MASRIDLQIAKLDAEAEKAAKSAAAKNDNDKKAA